MELSDIVNAGKTGLSDLVDVLLGLRKPTADSPSKDEVTALQAATNNTPPISSPREAIPYFPSQRYVDKKLAPEIKLGVDDWSSLAQAQKLAVDKGVLHPSLAAVIPAMAMVEGHPRNYGVKGDIGFYPSPATVDIFNKMGFKVNKDFTIATESNPDPLTREDIPTVKMLRLTSSARDEPAKLMTTILAIKARGAESDDAAIKLYNGKGKATELVDNVKVPANVDTYLKKVREAEAMLEHPANSTLKSFYLRNLHGS